MMRSFSVLVVLIFVGPASLGCFASHGADGETMAGLEHHERFVGDWHIAGGGGWALRATSTVYRFHGDGALEIVFHREGDYFDGQAARWYDSADDRRCEFGNRWWSGGSDRLFVESQCDDETRTLAELAFDGPESDNTISAGPRLVDPPGADSAWEAPQGSFFRCTSTPDNCFF